MAELTIDPASIRKALDDFVSSYKPSDTPTQEVGDVATAGDGIAHVTGLPGCMANELLTFEDGTLGLAFNLDAREIGVVILGDFAGIEEGQEVRRTGEVLSVPVGDGYLGRVVDPLGKPLDGLGEIQGIEGRRILEAQAPDVMHRHPVDEPLSTGLKAIDAMTPIGRGQRRTGHRRPSDRQDRHLRSTPSLPRRPTGNPATRKHSLHLCGYRAETLHCRAR